ncbi:MAG: hypothetical protein ABSB40_13275 [Nitrososphaeria archaeon]|jgi:DNA-binding MarR family transcriptional regulator
MSKRTRHTYLDNLLAVMNYCRQPKTMHAVKDKYSFSNEKLKRVIADLESKAYISISELPRDGRHVKQIILTERGKAELLDRGIKY